MPDPLPEKGPLYGSIHTRASVDGVRQTIDGETVLIPADVVDAWIANMLAESPYQATELQRSYWLPTRRQRIRRAITARYHRAMGWIHDRLFRDYCDHEWCM